MRWRESAGNQNYNQSVSRDQRECVSFEGQESVVTFDQYSQTSKEGFERQGYMPNRELISVILLCSVSAFPSYLVGV